MRSRRSRRIVYHDSPQNVHELGRAFIAVPCCVVRGMTELENELILRAIELLQKLVPDGTPRPQRPASRPCPVLDFARRYLMRDPADEMTTAELWQFYEELASVGEVEVLGRRAFERALPGAMEETFQGIRLGKDGYKRSRAAVKWRGISERERLCKPMESPGPPV